jgi:hypothetical protein
MTILPRIFGYSARMASAGVEAVKRAEVESFEIAARAADNAEARRTSDERRRLFVSGHTVLSIVG